MVRVGDERAVTGARKRTQNHVWPGNNPGHTWFYTVLLHTRVGVCEVARSGVLDVGVLADLELWELGGTDFLCLPASRPEAATAGWICW